MWWAPGYDLLGKGEKLEKKALAFHFKRNRFQNKTKINALLSKILMHQMLRSRRYLKLT